MNNYDYCYYGTKELKHLPDNYQIIMDGGQFWLMVTKIMFEPGKRDIPKNIMDIINKIKLQKSNPINRKTIFIENKDLLTLCNYKEIKQVCIISSKNENINNDIKKGISSYLANMGADEALLKIRSINDIDSLSGFINYTKGDNINLELKKALASYARICLMEFKDTMDNNIVTEMNNKINKIFNK